MAHNFSYRLRFEKEYGKYERLWKGFVECRKGLSDLSLGLTLGPPIPRDKIAEVYNEFQRAVRLEEPFLHKEVFDCAHRVLKLGSRMFGNARSIDTISKMREGRVNYAQDEKLAEKQIAHDDDTEFCLEAIEREMDELCLAIRKRLEP